MAVKEHKRRMAMPMQKDLKLCALSMAKCSKLSDAWTKAADGRDIDWSADGHLPIGALPIAGGSPTATAAGGAGAALDSKEADSGAAPAAH